MSPRAAIRDAIMCPLQRYPKREIRPFVNGRLLTVRESARLALMGKMDREQAVQAILKRYYG